MKTTKTGTIALVIAVEGNSVKLVDRFSDEQEIETFESALGAGIEDPLTLIYQMRQRQIQEEEAFGDYVESLLTQPFVRPEIQEHGVQWFHSKLRIEHFRKCENEATDVIAQYAFRVFLDRPNSTDFYLAGPSSKVRIRVFLMSEVIVAGPANAA